MTQVTGKAITRRAVMPRMFLRTRRDVRSVEIQITLKVSSVQPRGHFTSLCYQKKQASFKSRKPKGHMLQAGVIYACDKSIYGQSEDCSSSDESFCLQMKSQQSQAEGEKISLPSHLTTILVYRPKPHQTRNQYLRARLGTCVDVNIMPANVYKLVFNDPELKKLASINLETVTYSTNTTKFVGSLSILYGPPRH